MDHNFENMENLNPEPENTLEPQTETIAAETQNIELEPQAETQNIAPEPQTEEPIAQAQPEQPQNAATQGAPQQPNPYPGYAQPQPNPYPGYAQQRPNPYPANGQQAYSNPYQSPYPNGGQQAYSNPYRNPYQENVTMGAPAAAPARKKKEKKPRKKGGFGATLGKCATIAVIFGLVAGCVFTGVSYVGTKALGVSTTVESDNVSSSGETAQTKIAATSTGEAKELTDVSEIVEEVMPSIVAITNTSTVSYQSFFGQYSEEVVSCGSGIIVSQSDEYLYIATNNHVVSNSEALTVQFFDDTTVSAEVKGTDASDDLAVVQVAISSIEEETLSNIRVASISTDNLQVGQAAIAIGNALGYGQSVTVGVISALGRTITVTDSSTGTTITNSNLIQTDAAINPGNSGGALLNANGEVIGINSAKYSDTDVEGIGYAIPMSDAMPIIEQLITREKVDEAQSGYLGIQGQTVSSDVAEAYNMPEGVYIYQVITGSAAEAAGLRQGDIIVEFDGQQVTTMSELQELLSYYKEGQEATVTIERMNNGVYEEMDVEVTLGGRSSISE